MVQKMGPLWPRNLPKEQLWEVEGRGTTSRTRYLNASRKPAPDYSHEVARFQTGDPLHKSTAL